MPRKLIERRRRGFVGWIFLTLFWVWNVMCVLAFWGLVNEPPSREASQTTMTLMVAWPFFALLFYMMTRVTSGRKEYVEAD